jgi:hypothetical protein
MTKSSRLVSEPVPTLVNKEPRGKAQGDPSRQGRPGKGKTGRVNESELSMRLRYCLTTERTADYGGMGYEHHGIREPWSVRTLHSDVRVDTSPRSIGSTHPGRISIVRNVITPMESDGGRCVGRPTATAAELSSGNGMAQEANASSRKATGTHNRLDRVIPNLKGC